MIKSNLELSVTKDLVREFQAAIQNLKELHDRGEIDPKSFKMQMNTLTSNLSEFEKEILEYKESKHVKISNQNSNEAVTVMEEMTAFGQAAGSNTG